MHGFELRAIFRNTPIRAAVEEGSLYPALQRMLLSGWLTGDWTARKKSARALLPPYCRWKEGVAAQTAALCGVTQAIARSCSPLRRPHVDHEAVAETGAPAAAEASDHELAEEMRFHVDCAPR